MAAGEEKTFEWKALNPELFVYHCAGPPTHLHVAHGMYGLVLVEPAVGLARVDREYYVMQGELYTRGAILARGHQAFEPGEGTRRAPRLRRVQRPGRIRREELLERSLWVVEECRRHGFRYSPRLHILLWGAKPGV